MDGSLGVRRLDDLVGRADLLSSIEETTIDLEPNAHRCYLKDVLNHNPCCLNRQFLSNYWLSRKQRFVANIAC